MIQEIAELTIKEGDETAFEEGVAKAAPLFLRAKGCDGLSLHQGIEQPRTYRLVVDWETINEHTVHFLQSQDFQEWRRLVGVYFEQPPMVTHSKVVNAFAATAAQ